MYMKNRIDHSVVFLKYAPYKVIIRYFFKRNPSKNSSKCHEEIIEVLQAQINYYNDSPFKDHLIQLVYVRDCYCTLF